jgi:hypothetical protein
VIRTPGDYRLALSDRGPAELELAVLRGSAELQNAYGRTIVRRSSTRATDRGEPSVAFAFNSAAWDPFDRWVEDQRSARYSVSASQCASADLRYYGGTLDQYGAWGYEPAYGYVWYQPSRRSGDPTMRAAGRVSAIRVVLGRGDHWAWPTHHWSLGRECISMVLDSGWTMRACLGDVGDRTRICRLVSAWIRWSCRREPYRHLSRWRLDGSPRAVFTPNVVVSQYAVDGQSPAVRSSLAVHPTAPPVSGFAGGAAPLRSPTAGFGDRARTVRPCRRAGTVASPLRAAEAGRTRVSYRDPRREPFSDDRAAGRTTPTGAALPSRPASGSTEREKAVSRYGSGRPLDHRAALCTRRRRRHSVRLVSGGSTHRTVYARSSPSSGSREFSRVNLAGSSPSAAGSGGNPAGSSPRDRLAAAVKARRSLGDRTGINSQSPWRVRSNSSAALVSSLFVAAALDRERRVVRLRGRPAADFRAR